MNVLIEGCNVSLNFPGDEGRFRYKLWEVFFARTGKSVVMRTTDSEEYDIKECLTEKEAETISAGYNKYLVAV
jgi:hypothetical protein